METAASPSNSGFHALDRRQLIGTIIGLQLTLLLSALDQTIVGTAMPKIIANLNGFERYTWVTTAYLLTSTIAVPIFGKLSDIYGRKWFYLGGAALFVGASALCGAAGDLPLPLDGMNQLILFRGLQGLAGGIISGLTFTVIGDIFPPAERGKYQGLFTAVWGLASVFGPTLGGWITDNLNWRWVFYVNVPVGAVALTVLWIAFPYFKPEGVRRVVDYAGVAALIACLVPLLLALTWAGEAQYGWTAPRVIGGLLFAAAMLGAFIFIETRALEPVLPLSLFKNSIISVSSISLFMTGMGMFGAILFIPLFMQGVIGISATQSGSLLTPMMLALMAGSIISGQLVSWLGRYKLLAFAGLALMFGGLVLLGGMGADTSRGIVVRNMLFVGVGLGLTMPIYTLIVQNAVDPRQMGIATASAQFFRLIGGTVGTAIFGSFMLNRYTNYFNNHVPAGVPQQTLPAFMNPLGLIQVLPQLREQFGKLPGGEQLLNGLLVITRDALVSALDVVFLVGAVLIAVSFVSNFFLKEVPLRKRNAPATAQPAAQPADQPAVARHAVPEPVEAIEQSA